MFIKQPFDEFLEFNYERLDESEVKVTLPIKPLYLNSVGVVHGGIISSLADVSMCNTIETDESNIQKAVTVELSVSFLKGAQGDYLVSTAQIVKRGKTLTHVECKIYDGRDQLVAKAKGIMFNS